MKNKYDEARAWLLNTTQTIPHEKDPAKMMLTNLTAALLLTIEAAEEDLRQIKALLRQKK